MIAAHLESLLADIVEEISTPNTEAIALGGSYARGTATCYSDIDIAHFVYHLPATQQKFHAFRAGVLMTVGQKSLAQERAHLTQPEQAIVLIPAYRELRSLYDPQGALAHFIADAQAFTWEPLQSAADIYASAMLMLTTEAPFKIASALEVDNTTALAYEIMHLLPALTRFVAVQRGVMVQTNNSYWRQVYATVGMESHWAQWHEFASGAASLTEHTPTLQTRGLAALLLFSETVELLKPILLPQHLAVTMETAQFARHYVVTHPTAAATLLIR